MNNLIDNKPKMVSKNEKIILVVLIIIFIAAVAGVTGELYCNNTSNNDSATLTAETNKSSNNKPESKVNSNIDSSSYQTCLNNAKDLGSSKDCCDCLEADVEVRKACRDAAATYDFSQNTVFKTFEIPSIFGRSGHYSACIATGTEEECKRCCDSSSEYACGDFQYCRTACSELSK